MPVRHDDDVKAELEKLRKQVAEIKERQGWSRPSVLINPFLAQL